MILGFVDYLTEYEKQKDCKYLTRNRRSVAVVDPNKWHKVDEDSECADYFFINGEAILDFIPAPFYPEIELRDIKNGAYPLLKAGVLVFNPKGWEEFEGMQEKMKGDLRHTHLNNVVREVITRWDSSQIGAICGIPKKDKNILKGNIDSELEKENIWIDINYPWELIENSTIFLNEIQEHYYNYESVRGKVKGDHPNLKDSGYEIVLPQNVYEKLKQFIGKEIILVKNIEVEADGVILKNDKPTDETLSNALSEPIDKPLLSSIIKPIGTKLKIQKGVVIEGVCVIDEGCKIEENSTIKWSTLKKKVEIYPSCYIEHCILLEKAIVLSNSSITFSIIGKSAGISYHVIIPCQNLKNIGLKEPENREPELFYTEIIEARHKTQFGAIIGDNVKLGMGTIVEPSRKIGKNSVVHSGCEIYKSYKPNSIIKREIEETPVQWIKK
jgi:NDP-sugar pyrophosphorylase family protein